MELYWAGTNITRHVNIRGCVHRDVSHGKCDCLELTLDHAATWYRWGPEEDDEIQVIQDGYDTGKLYLNTVIPEEDRYRVLATSTKRAAARRAWGSYRNVTLEQLVNLCAAECQMEGKLYGVDGKIRYPFLMRENEGGAAFLERIGHWEGIAFKTLNGAFRGIGIEYAQGRSPEMNITIRADQRGVTYRRRDNTKYTHITVQTPWACATARDTAAKGNNPKTVACLPAMDNAQAGRWARGLLLTHNREAEEIRLETTLNTRLSAMARVDVNGGTDMDGNWIVDEAEHDLYNKTSSVRLLRVIGTIQ